MKKANKTAVVIPINQSAISQDDADDDNAEQTEQDPITVESIRACKGYENLSDEEAADMVFTLKTLAEIMVTSYLKKNILIDNQHIVSLNSQKQEAA